jgi:Secretion system C-terminal sorting domain
MKDWMLVDDTRLNEIFPGLMSAAGTSDGVIFQPLPLAQQVITSTEGFIANRFALKDCFPNPAKDRTTVHFLLNSNNQVTVNLINNQGKQMKVMVDGVFEPGEHKIDVDLAGLPAGHYIYQLKTGFYKESKKLVILK